MMESAPTISPELDAAEAAIDILVNYAAGTVSLYTVASSDDAMGGDSFGPICQQWREAAIRHLQRSVDRQLRDRPKIDSEQMFQAMLKDTAHELRLAGVALEQAAQLLIAKGSGHQAQHVHFASQRALKAAEGLIGS